MSPTALHHWVELNQPRRFHAGRLGSARRALELCPHAHCSVEAAMRCASPTGYVFIGRAPRRGTVPGQPVRALRAAGYRAK